MHTSSSGRLVHKSEHDFPLVCEALGECSNVRRALGEEADDRDGFVKLEIAHVVGIGENLNGGVDSLHNPRHNLSLVAATLGL